MDDVSNELGAIGPTDPDQAWAQQTYEVPPLIETPWVDPSQDNSNNNTVVVVTNPNELNPLVPPRRRSYGLWMNRDSNVWWRMQDVGITRATRSINTTTVIDLESMESSIFYSPPNPLQGFIPDEMAIPNQLQPICPMCRLPYSDVSHRRPNLLNCGHSVCQCCLIAHHTQVPVMVSSSVSAVDGSASEIGSYIQPSPRSVVTDTTSSVFGSEGHQSGIICNQCNTSTLFINETSLLINYSLLALSPISLVDLQKMKMGDALDFVGLLCPVCLDDLARWIPRVLKCGHSLCELCILKLCRVPNQVICPQCNYTTYLTEDGAASLIRNLAVETYGKALRRWAIPDNNEVPTPEIKARLALHRVDWITAYNSLVNVEANENQSSNVTTAPAAQHHRFCFFSPLAFYVMLIVLVQWYVSVYLPLKILAWIKTVLNTLVFITASLLQTSLRTHRVIRVGVVILCVFWFTIFIWQHYALLAPLMQGIFIEQLILILVGDWLGLILVLGHTAPILFRSQNRSGLNVYQLFRLYLR